MPASRQAEASRDIAAPGSHKPWNASTECRGRPRVEGQAVAAGRRRPRAAEAGRRRACPPVRRASRSHDRRGSGKRSSAHHATSGMPTSHIGSQPSQALLPRAAGQTSTSATPASATCCTPRSRRGSARSKMTRSVAGRRTVRTFMGLLRWTMQHSVGKGLLTDCDTIDGSRAHSRPCACKPTGARSRMISIRPFCAVLLALSLAGPAMAASEPPTPRATDAAALAAPIDLKLFMGTWYVIGRVPNFIERGHVASVNEYELRDTHKVGITYRSRDGCGEPVQEVRARASVDPDSGNHGWRTWFYRVVPTHSRVLEVAPDYSWALIGSTGRAMAWIFAGWHDRGKAL
ncbi:hypothetical protein G6F68_011437 [Rhizopus microsporus]|nr:hypothetical protein G6F68_011437 [Rhizopus microsporus]